jgi:hypothetical protein
MAEAGGFQNQGQPEQYSEALPQNKQTNKQNKLNGRELSQHA